MITIETMPVGNGVDVVIFIESVGGKPTAMLTAVYANGDLGELDWASDYVESLTAAERTKLADRFGPLDRQCRLAWNNRSR